MKGVDIFLLVLTIVWTAGAVAGCIFSSRSITRRRRALASVQQDTVPDPLLLFLARWNLRLERNRFLSQAAFFVIGVVTLLPGRPDWQRVVAGLIILGGVALVYTNSYFTERMEEGAVELQKNRTTTDNRFAALEGRVTAEEARNTDIEELARAHKAGTEHHPSEVHGEEQEERDSG